MERAADLRQPPHHPLPTFYFLPFRGTHARTRCLSSRIEQSETFHLHARPIKLDALRLVIKGIDPLNLYELQFVPAARPVRGLRKAGTSAGVCACCFAVVKERGKGFYSSSTELLTSREEAVWQQKQGREGLQRCWWLHANLHLWMAHGTTEAPSFVNTKDTQPVGLQFTLFSHMSMEAVFFLLDVLTKSSNRLNQITSCGNIWHGFYCKFPYLRQKAVQPLWIEQEALTKRLKSV